jgi:hypothetical protein
MLGVTPSVETNSYWHTRRVTRPGTRGREGYIAASFGEEFSYQTDTSPALPPVEVHSRLRPYRSMATAGIQRRSIA